jgi:hypothetical protein
LLAPRALLVHVGLIAPSLCGQAGKPNALTDLYLANNFFRGVLDISSCINMIGVDVTVSCNTALLMCSASPLPSLPLQHL